MPSSESGSWVRVFLKGVSKPTIFLIFTVFFGLVLFLPASVLRKFGDADVLRDDVKAPVFLLFLFWAVSWAVSAATSEGFRRWRADRPSGPGYWDRRGSSCPIAAAGRCR